MMYLALTYDHRLLDGREAVIFLVKVSCYLPCSATLNYVPALAYQISVTGEGVH